MPDVTAAEDLVARARLDVTAAAAVGRLDEPAAAALLRAWDRAVVLQDREVTEAVEHALRLVPGVLRRRVLRVLA